MTKMIAFLLLSIPIFGGAQEVAAKADEWASSNSECAAFYSVVQKIVVPDAKPEYMRRFELHLRYAKGLHDSSESQSNRLISDIAKQAEKLNSATTGQAKLEFVRKGVLGCNSIESHTPLVIEAHKLKMKDN